MASHSASSGNGGKSVMNNRAYSTEFSDHQGLIRMFASKCHRRLVAARVRVEYEDVYQEMCITFVKAARAFDPTLGLTFTAYLGRSILNNFNKVATNLINGASVVQPECDFSEDFNIEEEAGEIPSVESDYFTRRNGKERFESLSRVAQIIVAEMLQPSPEITRAFEAHDGKREVAEAMGKTLAARKYGPAFIGEFYGFDPKVTSRARKEIESKLGVTV